MYVMTKQTKLPDKRAQQIKVHSKSDKSKTVLVT